MPDYPKEQLWELYEQLPEDLKKATFSEEIGQTIQNICSKNNIADNGLIFNITKNIGYVFLGLLAPDEFFDFLKEDLKLKTEQAEEINNEIIKFVFMPIKESLEKLYGIKIETKEPTPAAEPKLKSKKEDNYRELIE